MARAPSDPARRAPEQAEPRRPSAFVQAVDEAAQNYLLGLLRERGGLPPALAEQAQRTLGNRATEEMSEPPQAADTEAAGPSEAGLPEDLEGRVRDEEEDEEEAILPDPDEPAPADPAEEAGLEDETAGPDDAPPAHDSATPETAVVPPSAGPASGTAPAGGGGVVVPSGGGAGAVVRAAEQTAANMPNVSAGRPSGRSAQPSRRQRRRPTRRRVAGPPPVPTVEPDFVVTPDPIEPATQEIERIAGRRLPAQEMPAVPPSPGENTVPVPRQPLARSDLRMISLGVPAMDRAGLSQENGTAMPGESRAGETRNRLLGLREQLLNPEAAGAATEEDEQAGAEPAQTEGARPTPREGAEEADAEAAEPDAFTVDPVPLPPADMTVAEQEMFTAVIANLKAGGRDAAETLLDRIKKEMSEYPGVLTREDYSALDNLGKGLLPELQRDMDTQVDGVAEVLGTAGTVLDQAVADRRRALESEADTRTGDLRTSTDLDLMTVEATAQARLDDAAAAREQAAEARRRAGSAGAPPQLGFRQTSERVIRRIQADVSEAIARFEFEKRERHRMIDAAKARWISAVDLAVLADQFDAERAQGLTPGAPLPSNLGRSARRRILSARSRADAWKRRQVTFIDGEIRRMKGQVDATVTQNTREVQTAGADAFRALRDWGNTQEGAVDSWWQGTVDRLNGWAENATDTANTWADMESRLARLELQRGAQVVRSRIEGQIRQNEEELAAYQALTEGQRRNFVARNILNSNALLSQIGAPMRQALYTEKKDSVSQTVEQELFALPRGQAEALEVAAKAKNGSFSAVRLANTIRAQGVDKVGTGEREIFKALSGLRKIERLALIATYNLAGGSDNALYDDLDGEFSGDEWRRAQALMEGRHGAAAAEAVHDAVFGPGTGEPQIFEALETINRLPEPDRTEALAQADATYRSRYGESLTSRLRGDLGGSELRRALALAAGNMGEADVHELNHALTSRDADAVAAVYERIRSEELQRARREGLTPTEYEAAVHARNQRLDAAFQEQYGNVGNYNWGGGSTLENAIVYNFAFDEGGRHRIQALQAVDMAGVSAGHMQAERRSFYADDEVMGNIVTAQHQRAADIVELERGPEMRANVRRRIAQEVRRREDAGTPMTQEQIQNRRMALDREVDLALADAAFDRARQNIGALDSRLQDRYGITLDNMITNTMSDNVFGDGGDLSNARARVEIMRRDAADPGAPDNRRLDWAYTRVRFGIEGAGTDLPELRGGLSGLTRQELARLSARWAREHDGETLEQAIRGDTSGRDEGDLIDTMRHGVPLTVQAQVDQLRRRLERDEASVGLVGAWASEHHSARSHARLARLEGMARRMRDPNLTPAQRESISASFDEQRGRVEEEIQAQRDRVDAYADLVTTVIGYVVSAIVIIAAAVLTVVSGGTLSPALGAAIAISGSIVGTVSGIAAKAAIKGGAYGMEELGTDIAVGLVDLAVTMATAGLFKGGALLRNAGALMSGVAEEVKAISRQSLRTGMQAATREAARASAASAARTTAREAAETTVSQRILQAGRGYVRQQAVDVATGIPATLTANLLNEQNWRNGNVAANMMRGTWEASLQNLRDGVIMGAGGSLATRAARRMVPSRPLTPAQAHARDIRHWRHENPLASPAEYARFIEGYTANNSDHADVVRAAQRAARTSLLSEIPPRERGAVADVPIIHVNDAQFRTYNKGNFGDAFVHVQNGQAVIIVRDGAPASAVARIGPQLRDIVAPGTRGRTVNPAESLPPRLRNRVPVEVVNDPNFGADEVRAVPQRDRDGNITGVALQVGPNARAIDIQMHVNTVDAMRRYAGLAGRVRMFLNRIGRGMGIDIVDPSQLGRWEAQLEVAKLPRIIEERMGRLSEHGLDPRRRALVMEEIASLERQFVAEVARLERGADAESRGYVAAQPKGDPDAAVGPARDSDAGDGAEPPVELTPEDKQRLTDIVAETRSKHREILEAEQAVLEAEPTGFSKKVNRYIETHGNAYWQALRRIQRRFPQDLRDRIEALKPNPEDKQAALALLHADLKKHGLQEAAQDLRTGRERNKIRDVGARLDQLHELLETKAALRRRQETLRGEIADLQSQYRDLAGNVVLDVPLHPDLPTRASEATVENYLPELSFEKKFIDTLGKADGTALMLAILRRIDGDRTAFDAFAERKDIGEILTKLSKDSQSMKTLEDVFQKVIDHRNGYRAELALASQIAGGIGSIEGLPGDGSGHTVIDFGDPIGQNNADVISVDASGNVFLWDSKYHGSGVGGGHSKTFTSEDTRKAAVADALSILERNPPNLSRELREAAIENLKRPRPRFYAVTSHTGPSLADYTHYTIEYGTSEEGP
ncbi:MAG: hypothetical protein QNJ44_12050 [Rhodobacter sp.]|nr:hypothetical protein [Rhodobacter sp.]